MIAVGMIAPVGPQTRARELIGAVAHDRDPVGKKLQQRRSLRI